MHYTIDTEQSSINKYIYFDTANHCDINAYVCKKQPDAFRPATAELLHTD